MSNKIAPIQNNIVLYQSEDGKVIVDVLFQDETVWLPIEQMAALFGKSRSTINEHILHIYEEGELTESETMRKIGISDFSTREMHQLESDFDRAIKQLSLFKSISEDS